MNAPVNLPAPPKVKGGLPLIGQGIKLARAPEQALREMYKKYGPIFQFDAAHFNYVCLAGPEANIFVNGEGKDCFAARDFWGPITDEWNAPNAIVRLDGEKHRKVRGQIRSAFDRNHVTENVADVVRIVEDNFKQYSPGEEIPMVLAGQKLASNIVGFLMMDMIPTDRELREMFFYFNNVTVLLGVLRLPRKVLKLRGPGLARARRRTFDFAQRAVAHAMNAKT